MRGAGVKFESERKEREEQRNAMLAEVETPETDLVFYNDGDKTEVKPTIIGKIKDLKELVRNLLNEYDKADRLTWHNGAIPEDQIWLKIGADHGGGSFKITLQIANINNPNSKNNTVLLLLAECKDTYENIK